MTREQLLRIYLEDEIFKLSTSTDSEIDCAIPVLPEDIEAASQALDCYRTYQETIREVKVLERIGNMIYFEFFQENFDPHLTSIFDMLPLNP